MASICHVRCEVEGVNDVTTVYNVLIIDTNPPSRIERAGGTHQVYVNLCVQLGLEIRLKGQNQS